MLNQDQAIQAALAALAREKGGLRCTPMQLRAALRSRVSENHRDYVAQIGDGRLVALLNGEIPRPQGCAIWYREDDGNFRIAWTAIDPIDPAELRGDVEHLGWVQRFHELVAEVGEADAILVLTNEWFLPRYASASPCQCPVCHILEDLPTGSAAVEMVQAQGQRIHEQCRTTFYGERAEFARALRIALSPEAPAMAPAA